MLDSFVNASEWFAIAMLELLTSIRGIKIFIRIGLACKLALFGSIALFSIEEIFEGKLLWEIGLGVIIRKEDMFVTLE